MRWGVPWGRVLGILGYLPTVASLTKLKLKRTILSDVLYVPGFPLVFFTSVLLLFLLSSSQDGHERSRGGRGEWVVEISPILGSISTSLFILITSHHNWHSSSPHGSRQDRIGRGRRQQGFSVSLYLQDWLGWLGSSRSAGAKEMLDQSTLASLMAAW